MNYRIEKMNMDGDVILSKVKRSKIAAAILVCDTKQNNALLAFKYRITRRENGQVLRMGLCPLTEPFADLVRVSIIDNL